MGTHTIPESGTTSLASGQPGGLCPLWRQEHVMTGPIVNQTQHRVVQGCTIERHDRLGRLESSGGPDHDHVETLAVAVLDGELGPIGGDTRPDSERITAPGEPENRLEADPVHPARRAGVPGPAAARS